MYDIEYTPHAIEDIKQLKKNDHNSYGKLQKLLYELMEHPKIGTGKPEILKYYPAGCYSRRISKKHRLVYRIMEEKVVVLVLSVSSHYGDK